MKYGSIKELMVPLTEYATVEEDASLLDAIVALEKAQKEFDQSRYRHRAVLVRGKSDGRVVGKISQLDVIRALEPKYGEIGDTPQRFAISRFGFSQAFLRTLASQFNLWSEPLESVCRKAGKLKVTQFMYTPSENEYVGIDATLDEAMHQLVMGHHQSLLVVENKRIVGILRTTDVFKQLCDEIMRMKNNCTDGSAPA